MSYYYSKISKYRPDMPLCAPGSLPPAIMQLSASRISHQEIPGIEGIKTQIPMMEDINVEITGLEDEISGILNSYGEKDTFRNMLLPICVTGDAGVLTAVHSGPKMKERLGCASATSTLVLAVILSVTFIVSFAYVFFVQFRLLKHAEQLHHERDSVVDGFLPDGTLAEKRRFCANYRKNEVQSVSTKWWLPRALFVAALTAVSACLLFSSARLLC